MEGSTSPVLLLTWCSVDQQTSVSSPTPTHYPAPPGLAYQSCPMLPHFYLLPFRTQEKPLQIYVWSFHSQAQHLESPHLQLRLKGQFFPGPQPDVLAMFLPTSSKVLTPSHFPCFPKDRDPCLLQPQDLYLHLLVFIGMVCVRHLPHNIRMVPTASKSNCVPSCPHLSPDMSHHVSILHWKVPREGNFCGIHLSSTLEQGLLDNRCSFQ